MLNIKSILRISGFLLIFLAVVLLFPLIFSLYYQDGVYFSFIIAILLSLLLGLGLILLIKKDEEIKHKEGLAIVTFGWLLLTAFGCIPYIYSGIVQTFTDAFFETMSGFTTTGASIFSDVETLPKSILLWRAMTNWLGGMGIIVLSLAILPFLGIGGMQLFKAEVPGPFADKLKPRIKETAKILWSVYISITALEVIILSLAGMDFFDSLCHSLATMATGGFSPKNNSIAFYNNSIIEFIIMIFMIIAGTNFSLHYKFIKGNLGIYQKNGEFRIYIFTLLLAIVLIFLINYKVQDFSLFDNLRYSAFQVVSLMTTTGFVTFDYENWHLGTNFILLILMFIGGSAGSTAGGLKVLRIMIIVQIIFKELTKLLHPNAIVSIKIGNMAIDKAVVFNILAFFIAYIFIALLSILVMLLLGLDFWSSIGSVAATINNIGPGFGIVGPVKNYASVPEIGKWILSFLMLIGRLEVFTVIVIIMPSFWKK